LPKNAKTACLRARLGIGVSCLQHVRSSDLDCGSKDPRALKPTFLVVALLFGVVASGAGANKSIASLFSKITSANDPGCAVLVRKGGRTLFERGYGVRDLRTHAKIDPNTNFRLASVSKQFTAMAIMLLVRDGKLHYDDALTNFYPDFPSYGRHITIKHLLTHTSGLLDYENLMEQQGAAWSPTHQIHDDEVLDLLKQQTRGKFAPGTSWDYSNSGYVLLGLIASKVSGKPFEQVMRDKIFNPLKMSHTLAFVNGRNTVPGRAYGYTTQGDEFVETDQSATSATLGDGGVYSNLTDLAKWDEALKRYTLLSENEMRQALTPVTLSNGSQPHWPLTPGEDNLDPGKPVSYGFGWFLDPYRGYSRMWHWGSTSGFRTAIERFPAQGVTVVVLCNRTDLDAAALALQAAGIILSNQ
jgi:CubicO group peptidase (beta-lactamase class C family)